ncbi:MAG: PEGA domain-containing protein [Candidatus Daviesbacteria bacterium]|nr:PEGA domain-containing protein [Candidatus Daviesbacteria bacterium]
MSKRFVLTIITLLIITVAAGVAIFLVKGYTFSSKERRIVGTGILTIASIPDSASVFLDGHLTTATNTTIASLSPKNYEVKVVKEGFIPWQKQVAVKEGLVTELKITLFPAIPTMYPLTFNGVKNPILSPDGEKLAYVVNLPASKKAGIWVWTQVRNQPISFARSAEPHQIAQSINIDFSKAALKWSADSKQVVAEVGGNNYLLDTDKMNNEPRDITPVLSATMQTWDEDARSKEASRVLAVKNVTLRQIASESALIRWSPDETKFIAGANEQNLKVYDTEDGKNYSLPEAISHIWLPDSRHVILVEERAISIADFDGSNKAVIYAGSFLDSFVFPWPDSSRLVIISSFPTPTASEPNLYGINLK